MQCRRVCCSPEMLKILPIVDPSKQSRVGFNWEVQFIVPGTNSYWLVLSPFPLFVFLFASQQQICSVSGFGSQAEFTDYYSRRARSFSFSSCASSFQRWRMKGSSREMFLLLSLSLSDQNESNEVYLTQFQPVLLSFSLSFSAVPPFILLYCLWSPHADIPL